MTAIANVRKVAPSVWILAPGVGAQGGELGPACEAGLMAESVGGAGELWARERCGFCVFRVL